MENEVKRRYLIQKDDNEIISYIKLSPKEKDIAEYLLNIASEWGQRFLLLTWKMI
jgi:hypothetical protein